MSTPPDDQSRAGDRSRALVKRRGASAVAFAFASVAFLAILALHSDTLAQGKPVKGPAKPAQAATPKPARPASGKPGGTASASPAQSAPAVNGFTVPSSISRISAYQSDGADVLFAAGEGEVVRVERAGATVPGKGPGSAQSIAVRGAGPSAEAAVVGSDGGVARFRSGAWEYALAPALDGESLVGAAFDASGRLYAAGQQRALYISEGNTWTLRRYPSGTAPVIALALAPDGTLYVVSQHGRLLTSSGGPFRDAAITGITADMQSSGWHKAWLSSATKTLWIAAKKHIIRIDLARGAATSVEVPLFFGADVFTGTRVASTDMMAVGNMKDFAIFDGTAFYAVAGETTFPSALFIDPASALLLMSDHHANQSFPLKHPAFGTGPGEVVTR